MAVRTISHYEILEKLGEGGMGVVYKARDARLERPVALKLLPRSKVDDVQRRARFIQEAKAASALNHPGIVTVYDIEEADGEHFIAMEYVQGNTLDVLIAKKTLKLRDILSIVTQVADALAAAHAAGILHRDMKPANIILTPQGRAKVLDFGLAKLTQPDHATNSETLTQGVTSEVGTVLGTVAYMSPEQAEGAKLDARSDLFSLGVVLYEMLTGQRPFRGDSRVSTMAAILREEPKPVSALTDTVSHDLDRVVARCLRKNPARRFQTMADLKVTLEELSDEVESGAGAPVPSPRNRRLWPWVAGIGIGTLAGGLGVWLWALQTPDRKPNWAVRQITFDSGLTNSPVLSRDGKLLAYVSDRATGNNLDIYVQQVAGGRPIRVTDHTADDSEPQFSPDGSQIAFRSARDGGGIYVVPALGGEARLLAAGGHGPQYSPDGKLIAYSTAGPYASLENSSVYLVPANGGRTSKVESDLSWCNGALWAPDGTQLLLAGSKATFHDIGWYVIPAKGGPAIFLAIPRGANQRSPFAWLNDGTILFEFSGGTLGKIRLDASHKRYAGPPQQLTVGAGAELFPASDASGSRIVFAAGRQTADLWALSMDGNTAARKGNLQRWTEGPATHDYPTASADGKLLAYTSNRSGNYEVYVRELDSGKERAVTSSPESENRALISPDGRRIAFVVGPSIGVIPVTGGVGEKLCEKCRGAVGWTADSRKVLTYSGKPVAYSLLDAADGKITPLISHPKWDLHRVQFSPDGQWIAFNAKKDDGGSIICVASCPGGVVAPESNWLTITRPEWIDAAPIWSPDGNLLYFHSRRLGFNDQWAVRLDPATKRAVGEPFLVQSFHTSRLALRSSLGYAVTKDWIVWSVQEATANVFLMESEKQP